MDNKNTESYLDFYDIKSVFKYIIYHYEKVLLLLLVFIIIYAIDYITRLNAIMYGITQIPGLPTNAISSNLLQSNKKITKHSKKKNKQK